MTAWSKAAPSRRIGRLRRASVGLALNVLLLPGMLSAQATQPIDQAYTAKIREYTTEPFFLTKYVDHLPASSAVPTPMDHFGDIAGAPNVLHYADEIHEYYRALEAASPRVKTFVIGTSEEGREIMLLAVSSEQNIAQLDQIRQTNLRLADPRALTDAQAEQLIANGKAMYWLTGAMHSTETGSPEMLIELAYRLAVSEAPYIQTIRDSMVVFITPVIEVDGRARIVDRYRAQRADPDAAIPPVIWWGKYVAHDNNRDNIGLSLELSRAATRTFLRYQPHVVHDLHESQTYLYASTGQGPYNAWLDPTTINEWNRLAFREVKELTELGVPGVFTHDFYDGWAPNYMFFVANVRNSIGRFYEVQSAGATQVNSNTQRQWHRPNTPLPSVRWSIRNNNNLSQSGVIVAMDEVANHKSEYLRSFYIKAKKSVAKATAEGPAAYVFPASDPRPGLQARLLQLMQRQGAEVHRLTAPSTVAGTTFGEGSYLIRMDQPFSRMVDMLLDRQYYSRNDPSPYDDTGWTLGPLFDAQTIRVEDAAILRAAMNAVTDTVMPPGGMVGTAGSAAAYIIDYDANNKLATFRFANRNLRINAAEAAFTSGGEFRAGSFIIPRQGNPGNLATLLDAEGRKHGFYVHPVSAVPSVATHPVRAPRVALLHSWQSTQTEGWLRIGLDEYAIPYDYLGPQDIRDTPRLLDKWDVILVGAGTSANALLNGVGGNQPIPYKATELLPNHGGPHTRDDIRGGMEFTGVLNIMNFLNEGGTLVTLGSSSALPVQYGLSNGVDIADRENLWAPGGVFRASIADATSPIVYGYGEELGVYFDNSPVFSGGGGGRGGRGRGGRGGAAASEDLAHVGSTTSGYSRRGGINDEDVVQGRPRIMGEAMQQGGGRGGRAGGRGAAGGRGGAAAEPPPAAAAEPAGRGGRGGGRGGFGGGGSTNVRTVIAYEQDPANLLISGGLDYAIEMTGTPALVHSRVGEGNVVMFSFNPFWRGETLGSYGLVFNTILHHADLNAGGTD